MLTIELNDQCCGPRCRQTLIVKVRLNGMFLGDLIDEAIKLCIGESETNTSDY